MATGPFAAPTMSALYGARHEVALLVTKPEKPAPGRKPAPPSAVRALATERGTAIYEPEDVNDAAARERVAESRPELLVVCDYGRILSPETLSVAPLGGVNLHGSLLPKYRGAAPVAWAIYQGETESGVSVIHMTPRLDAGPCLGQARLAIGPDETTAELEPRLAELGAPLVLRVIEELAAGRAAPISQSDAQATKAPRLKKSDGDVDWRRGAEAIRNQVRALEPWPRTSTHWRRKDGPPLRLILGRVRVATEAADPAALRAAAPGEVVEAGDRLMVATGSADAGWTDAGSRTAGRGALVLEELQPEGKRMLPAREFLRGYPVAPGDRLGPAG